MIASAVTTAAAAAAVVSIPPSPLPAFSLPFTHASKFCRRPATGGSVGETPGGGGCAE